jgi:polyphosphate kinase 2 (PPK2 family)
MLEYVNLELALAKEEYDTRVRDLQQQLYELEHAVFEAKVAVLIVFEGWSESGKGRLIAWTRVDSAWCPSPRRALLKLVIRGCGASG